MTLPGQAEFAMRCEALMLLCRVRWGLTFSSLAVLQRRLLGGQPGSTASPDAIDCDRLAWHVRSLARFVPNATCLTQGLVLQTMLHRRGIAAELRLGVRQADDNRLAAHAWVMVDGRVVLGGTARELAAFAPIAGFGSGPR